MMCTFVETGRAPSDTRYSLFETGRARLYNRARHWVFALQKGSLLGMTSVCDKNEAVL